MEYINQELIQKVAANQNISISQVQTVLDLLSEDNTVPFIARYRKEATGSLDEEQIRAIEKEYEYGKSLQKRKEDISRLIDEKGMLTEELKQKIAEAMKLVDLEDIYRPYKEKKKTKATEAIAKGLEPLAKWMMTFPLHGDLVQAATPFLNEQVASIEEAYTGAKYIIAEQISDNAAYRKWIREFTMRSGKLVAKKKKDAQDEYLTYQNYYEYEEPLKQIKLHRILAINRAEKEKVITVSVQVDTEQILQFLERQVIGYTSSIVNSMIQEAIADGYKRLIEGAIEREIRSDYTDRAEDQAIHIFSENLQSLLLQPPMKGKMVLGVDPAFRTGCKMAVIDTFGKYIAKDVIYPHEAYIGGHVSERQLQESTYKLKKMIQDHLIEIIAIGNGTASRETESFIVKVLKELDRPVYYVIVNEAGASVYSASDLAREEFPELQVEERSAVSIARRMQDPLSELVKIDPKAIGVGQYQHDVSQKKLTESLDFVVSTAVNKVGVNVNTASVSLLKFISGLSDSVAQNVVKHREVNGPFKSRKEILKVAKLGPKIFEQAVGFLRIPDSKNPLDKTPIHPESYDTALRVLDYLQIPAQEIGSEACKQKIELVDRKKMAQTLELKEITLSDLLDAFASPMRDPRDQFPQPILKSELLKLEDMQVGTELQGTVRNVVDFGCFVDCGIKEAGLVHISKMSDKFIKHPMEIVSVGQIVKVWVIGVDIARKRLQLTMIPPK
jgi:protein Tex